MQKKGGEKGGREMCLTFFKGIINSLDALVDVNVINRTSLLLECLLLHDILTIDMLYSIDVILVKLIVFPKAWISWSHDSSWYFGVMYSNAMTNLMSQNSQKLIT